MPIEIDDLSAENLTDEDRAMLLASEVDSARFLARCEQLLVDLAATQAQLRGEVRP